MSQLLLLHVFKHLWLWILVYGNLMEIIENIVNFGDHVHFTYKLLTLRTICTDQLLAIFFQTLLLATTDDIYSYGVMSYLGVAPGPLYFNAG